MSTSRDIIKQLEEQTLESERLKAENKKLRAENRDFRKENARLRERIEVLERSIDERVQKAVDEAVTRVTTSLQAIIAEKDKEIKRLKAQINKDSTNSSKPPVSNGYKKIPNSRENSVRKQGGQLGHKGTRLCIPENLKELVASGMAEHVIESEVAEGDAFVSDWTIDIKTIPVFTEYRRAPGRPPQIGYGMQLRAVAVYLCVIGLMSYKRLCQFLSEVSGGLIGVSKAAVEGFVEKAAANVDLEPLIGDLLDGNVLNVDETPIRTSERPCADGTLETAKKTTFSAYIRTYSNTKTTVLTVNPYKTEQSVVTDNILTRFHGIVAQDHESKFYNFGDLHATCGAHLTRELKGMYELQMLPWAEQVRRFFLEMNDHKNNDLRGNIPACESFLLCQYENRYDKLLQAGKDLLGEMPDKSFGRDELRRMVNRFDKHKDSYMLFIRDYDAPFTNNQAERDLRHCKTKQKVSGCFRSWQGVLDYCKIRSLLDSAKKRGSNLLNAISSLLQPLLPAGQ